MGDYPQLLTPVDHMEPVPRRIRGVLAGEVVFDTTAAVYLWEWPNYPQYYIPVADIRADLLVDDEHVQRSSRGAARRQTIRVGNISRPGAMAIYTEDCIDGLAGMARFDWDALDAWYEEDEQVFVHPRNPYSRVDALRSTRHVRVELDATLLADSSAPVMVFETGLPTRYYLNPTEVRREYLVPSDTVSACPYKGNTSGYWSVRVNDTTYADLAWSYDFPTRQLLPIKGLIAFYNEKVDITLDGVPLARPVTHFFD